MKFLMRKFVVMDILPQVVQEQMVKCRVWINSFLSSILSLRTWRWPNTYTTVGPVRSENYSAILTARKRVLKSNNNTSASSIPNPSRSLQGRLQAWNLPRHWLAFSITFGGSLWQSLTNFFASFAFLSLLLLHHHGLLCEAIRCLDKINLRKAKWYAGVILSPCLSQIHQPGNICLFSFEICP